MKITKFSDFLNESTDTKFINSVTLNQRDCDLFKREPILVDLISKRKIKIIGIVLSYDGSDQDVVETLSEFIELK